MYLKLVNQVFFFRKGKWGTNFAKKKKSPSVTILDIFFNYVKVEDKVM